MSGMGCVELMAFSWCCVMQVVEPGAAMGRVSRSVCDRFGLPHNCTVAGGTTDSIAYVRQEGGPPSVSSTWAEG